MFEKVNPCHPDKVADRIAGAIVDLCYTKCKNPKVACEVLIGHGECTLQIETSESLTAEELEAIVHRIAGEDIEVRALIVPQDVHLADNQAGAVRCGDNGIFRGCAPTHEQKLLTAIAHEIYKWFPTDGKYIVNTKPSNGGRTRDADFTICQSCTCGSDIGLDTVILDFEREHTEDGIYKMGGDWFRPVRYYLNPLGPWTGGPNTDSGATNRKLGSDMGEGVTGGGLHGKDLSKADVSVNIWAYLESIRTGREVTACCSIGDETVCGIPYRDIVEQARLYIHTIGGFERFAEWGLIRHI